MSNLPRASYFTEKALQVLKSGLAKDILNFFVEVAARGPSPYNTQPWKFTVQTNPPRLLIMPNIERRLLYGDPELRGLYFTLGAALQNVVLAAEALGKKCTYELCGTAVENFQIVISFEGLDSASNVTLNQKLLRAIEERHNNRFAFEKKSLPGELRNFIQRIQTKHISLFLIEDPAQVQKLQAMTQEAVKIIFGSKKFTKELSYWLKPSLKSISLGMPGYILGIPRWFSFILPLLIRYGSKTVVVKTQQKVHARWFDQAQIFGFLGVSEENPKEWIEAGQVYESLSIEAQKYGVVLGAMSALVEAPGFADKVSETLHVQAKPVMMFRIGYATTIPPQSPRLPIEQIIT